MIFDAFAATDVGRIRQENQDSFGLLEAEGLYFVCDGMGGAAAGDFASRAAAEIILRAFSSLKPRQIAALVSTSPVPVEVTRLVAAVRIANRALHSFSARYPLIAGMGTTFVGLVADASNQLVHLYHVGDSRVYRVRNGAIELLTRDHSKINELIEQGKMREDEVAAAEIQSMITRALGIARTVRVDYHAERVMPGDIYVLCSDGLNGELSDAQILRTVLEYQFSAERIAKKLIESANDAAGRDNTTVIALKIAESGLVAAPPLIPDNRMTFEDETPAESSLEDRLAARLIRRAGIQVPQSAQERSLWAHPIIIGCSIAALAAGLFLLAGKFRPAAYHTKLISGAGQMAGIRLEVRVPVQEDFIAYKKEEDIIQKLQMLQEWEKNREKNTVILENVQVLIENNGQELFQGLTAAAPLEVQLPQGLHQVHLRYTGYRIITHKMELKDAVAVSVEPSPAYRPVLLLMIPD
jgi:protein phosphatase